MYSIAPGASLIFQKMNFGKKTTKNGTAEWLRNQKNDYERKPMKITCEQAAELMISNVAAYNLNDLAGRRLAVRNTVHNFENFKKMIEAGEIIAKKKGKK